MSAPYMPFYVGDYLKDTPHLTTEQHGAYVLLIFAMFTSGGFLPNDERKLARIARLSGSKWAANRDDLMEFFIIDGDVLTHKKVTEVSKKYNEKIFNLAKNGAKGGFAKSLKNKETPLANATNLLDEISSNYPSNQNQNQNYSKKEIDKPISKERRKSRLKPDWALTEKDWQYALSKGMQQKEIENEESKFRDYYLSSGTAWIDWEIVWKRWVGRCIESGSKQTGNTNANRNGSAVGSLAGEAVRLAQTLSRSSSTGGAGNGDDSGWF